MLFIFFVGKWRLLWDPRPVFVTKYMEGVFQSSPSGDNKTCSPAIDPSIANEFALGGREDGVGPVEGNMGTEVILPREAPICFLESKGLTLAQLRCL